MKFFLIILLFINYCNYLNNENNENASTSTATTAYLIDSLNENVVNCGGIKGILKQGDKNSFTLLSNNGIDIIQLNFTGATELDVKVSPQNWTALLEVINPNTCSSIQSENSSTVGGIIDIVISSKSNNFIRIKSYDGKSSGNYLVEIN